MRATQSQVATIAGSAAAVLGTAGTSLPPAALSLLIAGMLAVAALWVVFPQNSRDRLAWWSDRRRHREQVRSLRHEERPRTSSD